MLSFANLALWFLATLVEAFVVYLFVVQGLFRQFLFLNLYLLLSVTTSVRHAVLSSFGSAPSGHYYFDFFVGALSETFLFFSICQLGAHLAGDKMPRRKMVLISLGGFIATAGLTSSVVSSWGLREATLFAVVLSRNIFLVCCLAIAALWAWKLCSNPTDSIANRLVNVLSVYFALLLLADGAHQMAPNLVGLVNLPWMDYLWLPVGSGFALVARDRPQD